MAARKDLLTVALPAPRLNRQRWCCSVPAWPVWPAQRVVVAKPRRKRERLSRTLPDGSARTWMLESRSIEPGCFESAPAFRFCLRLGVGKRRKANERFIPDTATRLLQKQILKALLMVAAPNHHSRSNDLNSSSSFHWSFAFSLSVTYCRQLFDASFIMATS